MKTMSLITPRFAFFLFSLVLAFALSSTSKAAPAASQYTYPIDNHYVSTLTSAVTRSKTLGKVVRLEVRPERRKVALMEKRNVLNLRLFQQPKPAPLMFVIPGLGGYPASGSAMVLAETYFSAGYSVITLPSNISWQYALSVSKTAKPGYLPRDTKEYYSFMKLVTKVLKNQHSVKPTGYAVSGVSLGGLLAAFIADEDSRQQTFKFDKVILINPAVDVAYGIKVLDSMHAAGKDFTPAYKQGRMALLIGLGEQLLNAPLNAETFQAVSPKLSQLNDSDMSWVIGHTFRQNIRDVIVAGERVNNTGLIKTKATRFNQNGHFMEAEKFSFADYMDLVVYPSLENNTLTREEVLANSSLYSKQSLLRNNPNVYVIENEDDFIVTQQDFHFLKATLGDRLVTYPHGGHLGNLWWEQNQKDLIRIATPAR